MFNFPLVLAVKQIYSPNIPGLGPILLHSGLSFFPASSFPDVLSDPTYIIWREGTPFEAITDRTVFIDGILSEVFGFFLSLKVYAKRSAQPPV